MNTRTRETVAGAASGATAFQEALVDGRRVPFADEEALVEKAVALAAAALPRTVELSSADRAGVLDGVARELAADADALAEELAAESGYLTHRDMVLEVQRSVEVFTLAAAVARVGLTETVNLDAVSRARGAIGIIKRVPYGPVLGITAFNGPILIAAHKVAPAVVAGAPIIIKPAPRVPRAAVAFAERVVRAGWPADAIAVLPASNEMTMKLVLDPRLPVISFTGGSIGWTIKEAAPRKHVHLELGGVGAVIVAADADLERAADDCVAGGFVRSGQACLAVQRIYVEATVHDAFRELLRTRVAAMRVGDARDLQTDVGPLVDEAAAGRVEALIEDARSKGAQILVGGHRDGASVAPTLIADTTPDMKVMREEAFGPLVATAPVETLDEAVAETNAVSGALQVGVFTASIETALDLADRLRAGAVIINGTSAWRADNMPYGGVGTSGFGREGIRYMVEEITDRKVIVIRR